MINMLELNIEKKELCIAVNVFEELDTRKLEAAGLPSLN